jgi:hypothetical protein
MPATPDVQAIAREWAAKILGSRTTVPWMPDYFDEDVDRRAGRQLELIAELLPDALRTWAHRSGRKLSDVTAEDAAALAAEIALTVYQASQAQMRIDARTIDLAKLRQWDRPAVGLVAR